MSNPRLLPLFGPFLGTKRLNLGCAGNPEEGFDNLDKEPRVNPDILCDLGVEPIPVPDNTYDCVFASHCAEHWNRDLMPKIMADIHRILKPNSYFIGITPYGTSDDAWDNPCHRQLFSENTWAYFSSRLYAVKIDHSGYMAFEGHEYKDWVIVKQDLIPYPEFMNDPEIDFKKKHFRNVIQEIHVVMQAIK